MTDFDQIIFERERERQTHVPAATWRREEAAGRAPKRIRLSPRRVGWKQADIDAWIAAKSRGEEWQVTSTRYPSGHG